MKYEILKYLKLSWKNRYKCTIDELEIKFKINRCLTGAFFVYTIAMLLVGGYILFFVKTSLTSLFFVAIFIGISLWSVPMLLLSMTDDHIFGLFLLLKKQEGVKQNEKAETQMSAKGKA